MNSNKASSPTRGRTRPPTAVQKSRTKVAQYHPNPELLNSQNYLWKFPSLPLPSTAGRALGNEVEGGFSIISSAPWLCRATWGGRGSPDSSPQTQRVVCCKSQLALLFPEMPRSNGLTPARIPCRSRDSPKSSSNERNAHGATGEEGTTSKKRAITSGLA